MADEEKPSTPASAKEAQHQEEKEQVSLKKLEGFKMLVSCM